LGANLQNFLELQRNIFAQRLLKHINVTCKYGCGKKFPYDEMRRHLLICENKEYFCSFDNCTFKGKKNERDLYEEFLYMLDIYLKLKNNINNIITFDDFIEFYSNLFLTKLL